MRSSSIRSLVLLAALSSAGCGAPAAGDVCEQAARYYEECTGTYLTSPPCDEAAAAQARDLLDKDCGTVALLAASGKADSFWCRWFNIGCVADEALFQGPACRDDQGCAGGSYCIEGRCFAGVGSEEMARILDEQTGTLETRGNQVDLLVDVAGARSLRRELILGARSSIHLVTLLFEDNAVGRDTVALLVDAARRGVEVRVVVDAISQLSYGSYRILHDLAAGGVDLLAFNPPEWATITALLGITADNRIHEKVMVVDGTRAVLGGRNVGDSYLADGRWRDTDVYVTGPAVAHLQRLFLRDDWDAFSSWELRAGCPQTLLYGFHCPDDEPPLADDPAYYPQMDTAGNAAVRVLYHDPRAESPGDGWRSYLALIRAARRSIKITAAYFIPPLRLRKHLEAAVARGVEVVVITNSRQSIGEDVIMYYASLNYYEELIRAGVQIQEWQGDEALHAKTMVVDDAIAVVGSYNLDPRSAGTNSESLALIRDAGVVPDLAAAFARDLASCAAANYEFTAEERALMAIYRLAEPFL